MATENKKYVSLSKLGLYDEKIKGVISAGDEATLGSAKSYADSLAPNYDAAGAAATVQGKLDEEIARAKAAEEANAAAAKKAQDEVDALETLVGELPEGTSATSVVDYVNVKTAGIATDAALSELQAAVDAVEEDVAAIEADYLKAADKAELQGNIDQVNTNLSDWEQAFNRDIEAINYSIDKNSSAIDAIEADYLKAADKAELQGNIDTVSGAVERLTNGVSAEEVDGVNDLIQYVKEHGTEVTGIQQNISDNAEAIEAVKGRMDTAEGKITALETADGEQDAKIAALEAKFGEGEGSVEDMIADAVAAEKAEREAADAEVQADADKGIADAAAAAAAAATAQAAAEAAQSKADANETALAGKAAASDLTALAGRVETAEGEIDTLQSEMDAVEAKAAANETAIGGLQTSVAAKAEQTALQAEIERAQAAEKANADAIAAFVECSEEEINALFA